MLKIRRDINLPQVYELNKGKMSTVNDNGYEKCTFFYAQLVFEYIISINKTYIFD